MVQKKRALARRKTSVLPVAPVSAAPPVAPDAAASTRHPGRSIGPHEPRTLGLASARLRTRRGS